MLEDLNQWSDDMAKEFLEWIIGITLKISNNLSFLPHQELMQDSYQATDEELQDFLERCPGYTALT